MALAAAAAAQQGRILIRAGRVLNVRTGDEPAGQTMVVSGGLIAAIAPTASTPAESGDREIDLRGMTVLPGLIDVHTHLTFGADFDPYTRLSTDAVREALNGVRFARITLEAGFTSVRNVGASGFSDVALRDYIDAGHIPGPHMQVSGPPLGITGGHCDNNFLPAEYQASADGVADGIAAVQQRVRRNIKYGADLIKVCATGGVLSKGDDPQASQYSLEEMKALVADAHRLGRKVAAHAHGAQGILFASDAGVDSIEHGTYIDAGDIAAMKQHGTWLVPTLYLITWMRENGHLPAMFQQKMKDVSAVVQQNQRKAIAAGVRVALGTDAAVYPHGLNAHEVEVYVTGLGMTPLAAIQAGTINAAELMGWSARAGALEPGKWADVLAGLGDPLADVRVLQQVRFVMNGGVFYKQLGREPGSPPAPSATLLQTNARPRSSLPAARGAVLFSQWIVRAADATGKKRKDAQFCTFRTMPPGRGKRRKNRPTHIGTTTSTRGASLRVGSFPFFSGRPPPGNPNPPEQGYNQKRTEGKHGIHHHFDSVRDHCVRLRARGCRARALVRLVRCSRRHFRHDRRPVGYFLAPFHRPRYVLDPRAHGHLPVRRAGRPGLRLPDPGHHLRQLLAPARDFRPAVGI